MPQAETILKLLKHVRLQDEAGVRAAIEKLVAEAEAAKQHRFAHRLREFLATPLGSDRPGSALAGAQSLSSGAIGEGVPPWIDVRRVHFGRTKVVLPPEPAVLLDEMLRTSREADRLAKLGIPAARTVLLVGPPGCGKTLTAHAVAGELNRPLLYVRLEGLLSSLLGSTGAHLRTAFELGQRTGGILFFDEFEAIAKDRFAGQDQGEARRILSTLIQELDMASGRQWVIGATNRPDAMDPAIRRRFDVVLEIPLPGRAEAGALLRLFAENLPVQKAWTEEVVDTAAGLSGALIEQAVANAARRTILDGHDHVDVGVVVGELRRVRETAARLAQPSPTVQDTWSAPRHART